MVKATTTFEYEKYLLEPNDCHFLYSNLVEELPKEVPEFVGVLPDP